MASGKQPLVASGSLDVEAQGTAGFMRQLSEGDSYNSIEWTDVNLNIKDKAILRNVSGAVNSGEMACILGPSGAGKSTLLNILAGRLNTNARGNTYSGTMSMKGAVVEPLKVRSKIAYVMQEDALPALITPREVLHMSACLRLQREPEGGFDAQVSQLLQGLRLGKCADAYVGNTLIRGISGGEKKRTSVAAELITKPKMIFLDEPLSGLDSYAAWTVVQVLKDLAANGCAVLCTIHQPSSEIFEAFDKMVCLAEGRTCYCGAVSKLTSYMESVGHPVPSHYNPADHILFTVQKVTKEELEGFCDLWSSQEAKMVLPGIQDMRQSCTTEAAATTRSVKRKPFLTQLKFLLKREVHTVFRDKVNLVVRFLVQAIMGGLFACIFLGIGGKSPTPSSVRSHFGAICNLMIGTMFGSSQPLLLQFPSERPVFLREYASNMYGTVPYFLAKTIVELPITFLTTMEMILISYWVMDLQGNLFDLVLVAWGLALTAASTALFIGCNVAQAQRAQEFAPLIFVPQIIFSGIFITIDLIPPWLRWMQYLCALKYAINLGCIVEFAHSPEGPLFLEEMDIHPDSSWLYIVILVCIFAGFRFLAMVGLRKSATYVY